VYFRRIRQHALIQAVSLLPKTPAFQLKIVGDGPERDPLVNLCQQRGIAQQVSFLGALDKNQIPEFLHSIDVLVLPSLAEGMPTVVLEGMAAGVPVVATNVGATPTLIDSEGMGLLVPPQDPVAISQALERLRAHPDWCREIAANARKRVESLYSWEVIASQIEEVYRRVING
jgi:glycosyltransferase involved in cell wall biosynthesis